MPVSGRNYPSNLWKIGRRSTWGCFDRIRRLVLISQMNCGLVDARIDGRSVDVDPVELVENVRLILDRHPTDLNAILPGIRQRSLVPEQQEGAGLRFDARIRTLRLHENDRP